MFKKFSYLATVSVLATTVMSQAVCAMDHADFDNSRAIVPAKPSSSSSSAGPLVVSISDNNNLSVAKPRVYDGILNEVVNVIDDFLSQPATTQPQPAQPSSSTLWNVVQGTSSLVGNGFRKVGDLVRGNTPTGDLLANKGVEALQHLGGATAAGLVGEVAANEGLLKSARLVAGNGLRWIGGGIKASTGNAWEKPTLERELREFWIAEGFTTKPKNVLEDTACALYLSKKVNGVNDITLKYLNFVSSWNQNSFTTHSVDAAVNQENFVVGLIKALVQTEQQVDDTTLTDLLDYNVDLTTLPALKDVTEKKIMDDAKSAKKALLADQVSVELEKARKAKFLDYAQKVYTHEHKMHTLNKKRLQILGNGAQPQPLALTAAAQPLTITTGDQSAPVSLPAPPVATTTATAAPARTDLVTITQTVTTTTATGTPGNLARSMNLGNIGTVPQVTEEN